jgi:hypothetical protein
VLDPITAAITTVVYPTQISFSVIKTPEKLGTVETLTFD